IRCVCGKKIGPDPRNFNQRVSLGRNDLLIRTFLCTCLPRHPPPVLSVEKVACSRTVALEIQLLPFILPYRHRAWP
ncbi:MAG: hypothetical protein E6099_24860, partial [Enterobacter sp.]|nr:hypothetical protein [Enterobacter sp.]MDU5503489.1 hypothetical protein [Enterobacter sp.]